MPGNETNQKNVRNFLNFAVKLGHEELVASCKADFNDEQLSVDFAVVDRCKLCE